MYNHEAYQAAFSAMVEIAEDQLLFDPDFRFADLSEGRKREITREFIENLDNDGYIDLLCDASEDREWLLRDALGAMSDKCHDDLDRELSERAATRRAFEPENQRALAADAINDMRRVG